MVAPQSQNEEDTDLVLMMNVQNWIDQNSHRLTKEHKVQNPNSFAGHQDDDIRNGGRVSQENIFFQNFERRIKLINQSVLKDQKESKSGQCRRNIRLVNPGPGSKQPYGTSENNVKKDNLFLSEEGGTNLSVEEFTKAVMSERNDSL